MYIPKREKKTWLLKRHIVRIIYKYKNSKFFSGTKIQIFWARSTKPLKCITWVAQKMFYSHFFPSKSNALFFWIFLKSNISAQWNGYNKIFTITQNHIADDILVQVIYNMKTKIYFVQYIRYICLTTLSIIFFLRIIQLFFSSNYFGEWVGNQVIK